MNCLLLGEHWLHLRSENLPEQTLHERGEGFAHRAPHVTSGDGGAGGKQRCRRPSRAAATRRCRPAMTAACFSSPPHNVKKGGRRRAADLAHPVVASSRHATWCLRSGSNSSVLRQRPPWRPSRARDPSCALPLLSQCSTKWARRSSKPSSSGAFPHRRLDSTVVHRCRGLRPTSPAIYLHPVPPKCASSAGLVGGRRDPRASSD